MVWTFVLAVVLAPVGAEAPDEITVRLTEAAPEPQLCYPGGWAVLQDASSEQTRIQIGIERSPMLVSKRPQAAAISLGEDDDESKVILLDEPGGTGKGYTVAYVDTDGDGDLTDETPLRAKDAPEPWGEFGVVAFGPVPWMVTYGEGDGTRTVERRVDIGAYLEEEGSGVMILPGPCRTGVAELGDERIRIALGDYGNFCYNDFGRDRIWVDHNGDNEVGYDELGMLSKLACVAGDLWELEPAADGSQIVLRRYAGPRATVLLKARDGHGEPARVSRFGVSSEDTQLALSPRDGRVVMPPMEKASVSYEIALGTGPDGRLYSFYAREATELPEGETTLECGGPVEMSADVQVVPGRSGERGAAANLMLRLSMSTAAGHELVGMRGGAATEGEPGHVEITDPRGKVLLAKDASFG